MSPAKPQARRFHVGGDFYLTRYPPGSADALRIDVGFRHPQWTARREAGHRRAAFPGSAILVGGQWFEVARVETAGDPKRHHYYLRPWDATFTLRTAYELTRETCERTTAEHRQGRQRERAATLLALLPFPLGLLSVTDQRRIENRYGVSGARHSGITAAFLLFLTSLVWISAFALARGMHFGEYHGLIVRLVEYRLLFVYLGLESLVRIGSALRGEPMGSLLLVVPMAIARRILRALSPTARARARAERAHRAGGARFATARDRVRRLPSGALEVVSLLPKDHWTANVTGIRYRDAIYVLDEREVLRTPEGIRHRFLLCQPEHDVLYRSVFEYRPEEVRDVYRRRRRRDAAMWVESFATLWGFLDRETQLRLGRIYKYVPEKSTRVAVVGAAALGAALFGDSAWKMTHDVAGPAQVFNFLAAIYLIWESTLRWSRLRDGEIRGSLLGVLLKPLAVRFLRWE